MATKTERILSYLPSTFDAFPRPSALYTVADAFGAELLAAENSLAALMAAHWVDHADRGAELICDLACLARLYGLAPRGATPSVQCCPLPAEESVEEFREHLKRYVRTFIEGTVTVQGVLRVTAEALGLLIADDYADLDTWWTRADDRFSTIEPRGDDAASAVFGFGEKRATGSPSLPARISGDRDLSGGVDLGDAPVLRIKVDNAAPLDVDLAARLGKTSGIKLSELVAAINDALHATVASQERGRLILSSPTSGPSSRLEVQETGRDAATHLLGLASLTYSGAAPDHAVIRGLADLGGGVDLREARYLRIVVDAKLLAEVDCAGPNPASTKIEQIVQSINQALGANVASHDGKHLILTSPTEGLRSSIFLPEATAQDARECLLGPVELASSGHDARPAEAVGLKDLSGRVDLSARSRVRVRLDEAPAIIVDCAGSDPARTSLDEIVAALNKGAGAGLASHDGRFVHLRSPSQGTDSRLTFEPLPPEQDAADLIFGIRRRSERGSAPVRARVVGEKDLSAGFNAAALNKLLIALDGATPVEVNLLARAANPTAVKLDELAAAINDTVGSAIATHDGEHLILTSQLDGGASSVSLEPLLVTRSKRYVTRAFVLDEAARLIFGFVTRRAGGSAATRARVEGSTDLSRGVDLRAGSFLRLAVDDWPFVEIDCAGLRPRSTTLDEIITAINGGLAKVSPTLGAVASVSADGQKLVLTSPQVDNSRIAFEPPRAVDALDRLLGLQPQSFAGSGALSVTFEGLVDISEGIDLSAADRVKLAIDGGAPVEINCADPANPTRTSLDHITAAINTTLNKEIARHDGARIILISERVGSGSIIEFQTPSQRDATPLVFGITAPRLYHGTEARPARVVGVRDLQAGTDVRVARFLRVSFDNRPAVDVDLLTGIASPESATIADLVQTINTALNLPIVSDDGQHLIFTSPTVGSASRLELHVTTGADARPKLLGNVPPLTQGEAPAPAVIDGEVALDNPLNLSERRVLRISVDGGRPIDIDVAGIAPSTTFPEEVVARINARMPGMASLTDKNLLRLAAPTRGEGSSLELLPLRVIELIEYPPTDVSDPPTPEGSATDDAGSKPVGPPREVRHGGRWFVTNDGAADADLKVELRAPHGTVGPQLVNVTAGQRVRLLSVLSPGERVVLWRDPVAGLNATIYTHVGEPRSVAPEEIIAGPLGAQSHVPFKGQRHLSDGGDAASNASLQLNNPRSPVVVLLRAVQSGKKWKGVAVQVTEALLKQTSEIETAEITTAAEGNRVRRSGRVRSNENGFWLAGANDEPLVRLLAGPGVRLKDHINRVAAVRGPLHPQDAGKPLMLVERIDELFDVKLSPVSEKDETDEATTEHYASVTIGTGEDERDGLVWQINGGPKASTLVRASEADKSAALVIPRGLSRWAYFDCFGARFDQSSYQFRLAGARCTDRAVFNFSRFARPEPEGDAVVFASAASSPEPVVELRLHWSQHQPGAFVVNLPGELPARFGGRFNQTFFGMSKEAEEIFETVFTEPVNDANHLVTRIAKGPKRVAGTITQSGSLLVKAEIVSRLPPGFEAVTMPFRKPRSLTGGSEDEVARLYLTEKDVPGFIALSAREKGAWGNSISVAAPKAGPARFNVVVSYTGARFESARRAALGGEHLPASIQELLQPGPVGVLQAKAAGVKAAVTRDGAEAAGTYTTTKS